MASHIDGPLYFEAAGRNGPAMAFIHPNPMDQSSWMYQMAHLSTWYRCIAIDIPGYGRSPKARPGLTLADLAAACWEVVDRAFGVDSVILVICSAGSAIASQMYHLRPSQTAALVLSGTGFSPDGDPEWDARRSTHIRNFQEQGAAYRWQFTFEDFSPAFRATPLAHYFASLFRERNDTADPQSIIQQFEALRQARGPEFYPGIECPVLIMTGSEDMVHPRAVALAGKIPDCELRLIPGAGHACQLEQPWLFDDFLIAFLRAKGMHPRGNSPEGR